MHGRQAQHQPFAAYTQEAARGYEAWYHTPAGQVMAREEEALLARLLAALPDVRSVLEVGCGTGHFTRWFSGRGLTALGVDPAPAMLAVARELDPGGWYVRATAEALPLPDSSVDLTAFVTSLEFIDRPVPALREAGRVTRRALLLGVLNRASPLGVQRTLTALARPSSPYRSARFPTPWGLERLVRRTLSPRVRAVRWQTAVWPRWLPARARLRPLGAFIGMLVVLEPQEDKR